jgi:hypothetical protein
VRVAGAFLEEAFPINLKDVPLQTRRPGNNLSPGLWSVQSADDSSGTSRHDMGWWITEIKSYNIYIIT